jgi:hypothetical protein
MEGAYTNMWRVIYVLAICEVLVTLYHGLVKNRLWINQRSTSVFISSGKVINEWTWRKDQGYLSGNAAF